MAAVLGVGMYAGCGSRHGCGYDGATYGSGSRTARGRGEGSRGPSAEGRREAAQPLGDLLGRMRGEGHPQRRRVGCGGEKGAPGT